MNGTIELTTAPKRYPRRVRRNIWIISAFTILIMVAQTITELSARDMNLMDLLRRLQAVPSHAFAGSHVEGLLFLVVMPTLAWLSLLSMQMRLNITSLAIECSNRLPAWAKSLQPDWRIERREITSVCLDLSRAKDIPRAARIRFESQGKTRSIQLLGWYRVGQDVETQQIGIKRGFLKTDLASQIPGLPIIKALKEAGFDPVIDTSAVPDPLRKAPGGWLLALGSIGAMVYALIDISNESDLYAGQPPWLFIVGIAGLAAYCAWRVVGHISMKQEEKAMAVLAAAAMFGLAAWVGALRINAATGGAQEVPYHYAGGGKFSPDQSGAPELDLSDYVRSVSVWKPGEKVEIRLHHGVLGFWQYDRDLTISRLDDKHHGN